MAKGQESASRKIKTVQYRTKTTPRGPRTQKVVLKDDPLTPRRTRPSTPATNDVFSNFEPDGPTDPLPALVNVKPHSGKVLLVHSIRKTTH
jgi:hypothetical protein